MRRASSCPIRGLAIRGRSQNRLGYNAHGDTIGFAGSVHEYDGVDRRLSTTTPAGQIVAFPTDYRVGRIGVSSDFQTGTWSAGYAPGVGVGCAVWETHTFDSDGHTMSMYIPFLMASVFAVLSVGGLARPASVARWLKELSRGTTLFPALSRRFEGGYTAGNVFWTSMGWLVVAGGLMALVIGPRLLAVSTPLSLANGWMGLALELLGVGSLVYGLILAWPVHLAARRRLTGTRARLPLSLGIGLIVTGLLLLAASLLLLRPSGG